MNEFLLLVKRLFIALFWNHHCIGIVSCVISIAAIYAAAKINQPDKGGLGGAIGVAATFLIFFFDQGKAQQTFMRVYKRLPEAEKTTPNGLHTQITLIVSRLNVNDVSQTMQNYALAFSSVIGTLAWAFGNYWSAWLIANHYVGP